MERDSVSPIQNIRGYGNGTLSPCGEKKKKVLKFRDNSQRFREGMVKDPCLNLNG